MVPYAWIAGEFGTVDVKGHTFKVDTTKKPHTIDMTVEDKTGALPTADNRDLGKNVMTR